MNAKRWALFWLFVPLVLPGLIWLLQQAQVIDTRESNIIIAIGFLLLMSLYMGGIQYAITAAFLIHRFRGREFAFWHRLSHRLPVYYMPFAIVGLVIYQFTLPETNFSSPDIEALIWITIYGFAVCYSYVIVYHALTFILIKAGYLRA